MERFSRRAQSPSRLISKVVAPLVPLALILLVWSWYASHSEGGVFPSVPETAQGFWTSLTSGTIWGETWVSWRSLLVGYVIAAPIGIVLGLLLGASRVLDRLLGVYLDIALVTPMIVLMPVVLIAIGITAKAETLVIIFFALPYVILPIRNGTRALPQLWFELGRSLGASRWQLMGAVLLPGARGAIVRGLRLGLGHAVSGLFTVELTLAALGIGKVVLTAQSAFMLGDMLGYIAFTLVQVLIVMSLANLFDSSWREATA